MDSGRHFAGGPRPVLHRPPVHRIGFGKSQPEEAGLQARIETIALNRTAPLQEELSGENQRFGSVKGRFFPAEAVR